MANHLPHSTASTHTVLSQCFPENARGGIMVCGINFGFSQADEAQEGRDESAEQEPLSFFSDAHVNSTDFRNRIVKWLGSWGLPLKSQPGQEGAYERSFFQTNWLVAGDFGQTRSVTSNGVITRQVLLDQAGSVLQLIAERQPSVILFFGADLIQVFNDIRLRERIYAALGERSGAAKVYTAKPEAYTGRAFKLWAQRFGATQIICLPHPKTRGLTDAYVAALKPPVHVLRHLIEKFNPALASTYPDPEHEIPMEWIGSGANDPLFADAQIHFDATQTEPISALQLHYHIGYARALSLFDALRVAVRPQN